MNGSTVLDLATDQLNDAGNLRYDRDDLARYLTFALNEIALFRPAALGTREVMQLVEGAVQTLPATSMRLLAGVRNMGPDGVTPGKAIHNGMLGDLDAVDPDWMQQAPGSAVDECLYSEDDPRTFFVYPPAPNPATLALYIELRVVPIITDITPDTEDNALPITEDYSTALVNGVLAWAFSRSTGDLDVQRAMSHGQAFYQAIGASVDVKARIAPLAKEDRR